jgi:aspartokinase
MYYCGIVIYITNPTPPPGELSTTEATAQLSTAEAVSVVIRRNFVLQEALRMKVANYHALATCIAPKIEELTGRRANLPTLVVSIKRLADGMTEEHESRLEKILEDAKVTLTSGVTEVSLRAAGMPPTQVIASVLKIVPMLSTMPEIVQLPSVVKVLGDDGDGELIEKELGERFEVTVEEKMAKVRIRVSKGSERLAGLASFITELLFRNGIVIQSAYLGRPDSLLIVEEKIGARAYDVLRERVAGQ